jgi:hypothetical protein
LKHLNKRREKCGLAHVIGRFRTDRIETPGQLIEDELLNEVSVKADFSSLFYMALILEARNRDQARGFKSDDWRIGRANR